MNRFAYRVYYEWNGRSHANPFRTPKNAEQIRDALDRFPEELPHYMADQDAQVSDAKPCKDASSIMVVVVTTQNEAETDDAVGRCLNGLDLYGAKLKES